MSDDDDLSRVMHSIDPARTAIDAPLSLRAERDLARILSGTRTTSRRPKARWIAIPVIAATLAAAIAIVYSVVPAHIGMSKAEAATPPLLVGNSVGVQWTEAMKQAQAFVAGDRESTRGTEYSGWFLDTDVDADGKGGTSYVSPQDVSVTWAEDLSGRIRIVAGAAIPAVPDRGGDDSQAPKAGTVLSDTSYPAGQFGATYPKEPPADAATFSSYLAEIGGVTDAQDPMQVLDAVQLLLNEWTLGSNSCSALFQILSELPELQSMGEVTDRLGRLGQGYIATSPSSSHFEDMIVVDTKAGRILSIEKVYLGGVPEYKHLTPPAVTSYIAWK